jgi:hypothetical protein
VVEVTRDQISNTPGMEAVKQGDGIPPARNADEMRFAGQEVFREGESGKWISSSAHVFRSEWRERFR